MSSVVFMDLVRRVSASGRRVIALDLPGHGQSDIWHEGDGSPLGYLDGYREAVGTVCARLGISQAILLGHSMGGAVALRCATAFPDRVAGLVLLNSAAKLAVVPEVLDLLEATLPKEEPADPTTTIDQMPTAFADLVFSAHTLSDVKERWRAVLFQARRRVLFSDFRACSIDLRPDLARLRLPSLVVAGTDDLLLPPRLSKETASLLPGASYQALPNTGHLSHLEAPDPFHALLDPFLRAIP